MNWLQLLFVRPNLATSILYNEHTFYLAFVRDLKKSKKEVVIECPFIASSRIEKLLPRFREILNRNVKIHIE